MAVWLGYKLDTHTAAQLMQGILTWPEVPQNFTQPYLFSSFQRRSNVSVSSSFIIKGLSLFTHTFNCYSKSLADIGVQNPSACHTQRVAALG